MPNILLYMYDNSDRKDPLFQENPKWRSVQARIKLEEAGEYGLRSLHLGWFCMQPRNFSATTLQAPEVILASIRPSGDLYQAC